MINNESNIEVAGLEYQLMIKNNLIQEFEKKVENTERKLVDCLIFLHTLAIKEVSKILRCRLIGIIMIAFK